MSRLPRPVLPVVALASLLTACSSAPSASPTAAPAAVTASPTPDCDKAPLERRAAQVLIVGMPNVDSAEDPLAVELAELGVGGLFLSEPNVESEEQVTALVEGVLARAGEPMLVSTDEESGRVAVTREIVGAGPSPRRLAASRTPAQVREVARDIGEKLADIGVDLDLAPVLDLDGGRSGGIIGDRSFSADPEEASDYGLAFAAGLADAGVTPTVKHFPGQGRSTTDTHAGGDTVTATVEELRDTDLKPFQDAIDAGAPAIMFNHLAYTDLDPDLPASMSPKAYALLREMGFEGVAMTDSVGMGAIYPRWDFPDAAVQAISAGADATLATDGRQAARMVAALVAAVESGTLPEERLDEAAARMTALQGGDPVALTCREAVSPTLQVATASTTSTSSATATPSSRTSAKATAGATTGTTGTKAAPSATATPSSTRSASPTPTATATPSS